MNSDYIDQLCLKQVCETIFRLSMIQPERRGYTKDEIALACSKYPLRFSFETINRHIRYAAQLGFIERVANGSRGGLALYNYNWAGGENHGR